MEYQWSPCLQIFVAHTSGVSSVFFSDDSESLISASIDGTTMIWDTSSGECSMIPKKSNSISSIASFQGSKIVILTRKLARKYPSQKLSDDYPESIIKVWGTTSRHYTAKMNDVGSRLRCIAVWGSKIIITGSDSGIMKIWDTEIQECIQKLGTHRATITEVSVSQKLKLLASASYDHDIKIWDLHGRECIQTLTEHMSSVDSVAFSPDSLLLASWSKDHSIKIWSTDNWNSIHTLGHDVTRHWGNIPRALAESLVFSHDSKVLATGSDSGDIHLWKARHGQLLQTFKGHRGSIQSLAFSHDSKLLASASDDCTIRIWNATNLQPPRDFETLHGMGIPYLSYDSTLVATAEFCSPFGVKIWDAHSGKCLRSIDGSGSARIQDLMFSRDLKCIALSSSNAKVRVWNIGTGNCMGIFENPDYLSTGEFFSKSSCWII